MKEKNKRPLNKSLLLIAKRDLQASIILNKHQCYMQAAFYFQQSVEKALKSFGLTINIIKDTELVRPIGHMSIKVFEKLFIKQDDIIKIFENNIQEQPEIKKKFQPTLDKYHIQLEKINRHFSEIHEQKKHNKAMTRRQKKRYKQEFRIFIKELDDIDRELEKLNNKSYFRDVLTDIENAHYHRLKVILDKFIPENRLGFDMIAYKNSLRKNAKTLSRIVSPKLSIEMYYIMRSLHIMSIITYDLPMESRYPLINTNPLSDYNKKSWTLNHSIPIMQNVLQKLEWTIHYLEQKKRYSKILSSSNGTDNPS